MYLGENIHNFDRATVIKDFLTSIFNCLSVLEYAIDVIDESFFFISR